MRLRGYYAILDVASQDGADEDLIRARAHRLLAPGPCLLQIRAKGHPPAELARWARLIGPASRLAGVPLCVNDRLDVALAVNAAAVHLGQDDLPLAEARQVAAGRLQIGISTHNLEQADAAIAGGADYIGFGPIFPTTTKANPDRVTGLDLLRGVVAASPIPVVAIGGITLENIALVVGAGAAAAALIRAIDDAADSVGAGRAVNAAFGTGP